MDKRSRSARATFGAENTSRCRAPTWKTSSGTTAPTAAGARPRPTISCDGRKALSAPRRSTFPPSGNKRDQRVERGVRRFRHERVARRADFNALGARARFPQASRSARRGDDVALAEYEKRRKIDLRRALKPRRVVVAGFQIIEEHPGREA